MTTERLDSRVDELEIKISFQHESIAQLSDALVEKEHRIAKLEETVARLERALTLLAARTSAQRGDVAGAHPEEDPVPRSG
jgi:uncharacterized coiled-coil protein SlyX